MAKSKSLQVTGRLFTESAEDGVELEVDKLPFAWAGKNKFDRFREMGVVGGCDNTGRAVGNLPTPGNLRANFFPFRCVTDVVVGCERRALELRRMEVLVGVG